GPGGGVRAWPVRDAGHWRAPARRGLPVRACAKMTALSCSFPVGRSGTRPEAYHRLIPLNFGGNRASSSVFWRISAKASPLAQNVIATTAGVRMIETRRRPDCRRHGAKDGVRPAVRQGPALKPGSEPVLGAP